MNKLFALRAVLPRGFRAFKKSVTFKKVVNGFLSRSSLYLSNFLGKSFIWGMPQSIMIEPTDTCNLRCPLCAFGAGNLNRKRDFLKFERYQEIVDQLSPYLFTMQLWNQGEPFIHKDFLKFVKYASNKGIYTITSTNCHYLDNAEEIVKSGLDEMILSVDGSTAETFVKYRVGGNFEKVIEGIKKIVAARKKLRSNSPYLTFQFVISKQNEHEVESAEKLARELGVDEIIYKTCEIPPGSDTEKFLPQNPKYRRYEMSPEEFKRRNDRKNCQKLWQQPVLNADGEIAICCFDKDYNLKPGKMADYQTFKDFWQSNKFNKIRNLVRLKKGDIKPCDTCTETLVRNFKVVKF